MTIETLVKQLFEMHAAYGNIPIRVDLGFETNGLAHDIDGITLGTFPNEPLRDGTATKTVVIYLKSTKPIIGVKLT